jgi:asparagine N-glycosylation enzyme membrane subunit Stt3
MGRRALGDSKADSNATPYVKVCVLAVGSGVAYFAFAASWPGEPVTIRLVLAVGLVAINAIGDLLALRQRRLGEAWSAAHPADALDRKPMPAFVLPSSADKMCDLS